MSLGLSPGLYNEARLRASPPAAGRFCDKIPFRRMAIPAERFFISLGLSPGHKKRLPAYSHMLKVLFS